MSKSFNQIYPNQAVAICTRTQAEQLVDYDHHVVSVTDSVRHADLPRSVDALEEHTGPLSDGCLSPCGKTSACATGDPIHCG